MQHWYRSLRADSFILLYLFYLFVLFILILFYLFTYLLYLFYFILLFSRELFLPSKERVEKENHKRL